MFVCCFTGASVCEHTGLCCRLELGAAALRGLQVNVAFHHARMNQFVLLQPKEMTGIELYPKEPLNVKKSSFFYLFNFVCYKFIQTINSETRSRFQSTFSLLRKQKLCMKKNVDLV